jgi:heme exporter protein CcmB
MVDKMNLKIFLTREFKIFFAQPNKFLANLLFFIISLVVFSLFFSELQNQKIIQLKQFWFILIFSSIFGLSNFVQDDFNDGNFEQLIAANANLETYLFAKTFIIWLVNFLPILLLIITFSLIKNLENKFIFYLSINFTLTSLLLYFVASFCNSIAVLNNSSSLIAVIILPLFIPIILISCADFNDISNFLVSIKILLSLAFFIIPLSIFSSATIIKIANE